MTYKILFKLFYLQIKLSIFAFYLNHIITNDWDKIKLFMAKYTYPICLQIKTLKDN